MKCHRHDGRILGVFFLLCVIFSWPASAVERKQFPGHLLPAKARQNLEGDLADTNQLHLSFSLPLRSEPSLDEFIRELSDPASKNFRKFITPQEFANRFGPSQADYDTLLTFVRTNGFQVTGTHPNRVLVDVVGSVATVNRVFGIKMRRYRHPRENRDFFAPDTTPAITAPVTLLEVSGLDNYSLPRPKLRLQPNNAPNAATPLIGSGPGGSYRGNDFRAAYVPGTSLTGAGQSVGLLQFDGYYSNDIASYISQSGIQTSVVLTNVPINGGVSTPGSGVAEVSLDIEMAIAMAPGLDKIYVYEGPNGSTPWSTILSRMANDNLAKQLSCSWGGGGVDPTSEQIFKQMAAQGQSFFNASGDSDAFTNSVPFPADSTNITQVGATTLTTSSAGGPYVSEKVWNQNNGTGSSGGLSTYYKIPFWQTNINMAANGGSTTYRNIPDVALTGDNIYVVYNNGSYGIFAGTSCAAPLWAGYMALVNQQAQMAGLAPVGFVNPPLYAMANTPAYSANFHDVTTGNNTNANSLSLYYAVAGYDLCTGLGTPNGTNLINALAPVVAAPNLQADGWTLIAESATPANGELDPGETVTISFALINRGGLPTGNLIATLQTNSGVLAPSAPQTYGALAALGGTASGTFTFTTAGDCGSNIVANLQLQDGTNDWGTMAFTLPLGRSYGLTGNFDEVLAPDLPAAWTNSIIQGPTANWVTSGTTYDGAPNAAYIPDSASMGQSALVSPTIWIHATNAQLTFKHNYNLEISIGSTGFGKNLTYYTNYYDGGVLEIQIGNAAFTDIISAGGSFVSGGYNCTLATTSDNPLGGRSAWSGNSGGWTTTVVNLPAAAAGQAIKLRWNCAFNTGNSAILSGWYVDSVHITDDPPACLSVFADLAVGQSLSSNSLAYGQNLIYSLGVTNLGPQPAANVSLADTLPDNTTFVSATSNGSYAAGAVTFLVDSLPVGGSTNFTLTLAPQSGITFTNTLSASSVTPELDPINNQASLVSQQDAPIPAAIVTGPSAQLIECGGNASVVTTVTGTPPLKLQWSVDNVPVAGATNLTLQLTNIHLPDHLITVVVTNLYGGATNNVLLSVQDTLAPVVTLNGSTPMYVELGQAFVDPGATAVDVCSGTLAVQVSGSVNSSAVATNTLTYWADDGNGHTNAVTRTVMVRDTTAPVITWSFTNLVLAANTNCAGTMPDVTSTNFILASDLSAPLSFEQSPTNGADLALGTNTIVIAVSDAYGNTSYSTNSILVQDQTPPQFVTQPQDQTNYAGDSAVLSAIATACTPVRLQWYFGTNVLTSQTNSSLTLTNLTLAVAGNYSVVATAAGGSSTSAVATLTVNLLPATMNLISSINPAGYRDGIAFSAVVSPTNVAGSIQFFTNGIAFDSKTLAAGAAVSSIISTLPRGTNAVQAVYSGDSLHEMATNTLAQIVTNHPPSVVTAFYTNLMGEALSIPMVDLATNWSDADGDALSLAFVSNSTNGVVITNTGSALVYSNGNNVPDQFTCTITDGFGGTNYQTVKIAPAPPIILWSNTNWVMAADTNCGGLMPDVTTTNYIIANDLSGVLSVTQNPTNGASLLLGTNVVVITVEDAYGNAVNSTNTIVVRDETAPAITLNGSNPMFLELGQSYVEPGAVALDACAGGVSVLVSGSVNGNVVGTNVIRYTADDGRGNTNVVTRTVVVRDTTPPIILWSNTNWVMAADTNCGGLMPDVTTTNYIIANDLSGPLSLTQNPTNGTSLLLGTNVVVITVEDAYGNAAFSTNSILVQDQTPPQFVTQPQSQTNTVGGTVSFTALATACTVEEFQWFFNSTLLDGQTNDVLTLANLQTTNSGIYKVVVTSSGGSASSKSAGLFVTVTGSYVSANVPLALSGMPGTNYVLETSTNIFLPNSWVPFATNTLGSDGNWHFYDPDMGMFSQRFFRLRQAP